MGKYEERFNDLFDKVLKDQISLGGLAREIKDFPQSSGTDPQRAIDLKILAKSYQVNRSIKIMTYWIVGMTGLNVILVALTTYFMIFH